MLLQLLNSKHLWKETSWDGAGGNGLLSWDELLGLLGWFCHLVVKGLGTPRAEWLAASWECSLLTRGDSWVQQEDTSWN